MSQSTLPRHILQAVEAMQAKKADNLVLLDMREAASFTDYFLICTSYSQPQSQAIADEVEKILKECGRMSPGVEGAGQGEWVLLDYLDFVVHIFQEKARGFYDLDRLWRSARRVELSEEAVPAQRSTE
jgi:ribosome-associated protein